MKRCLTRRRPDKVYDVDDEQQEIDSQMLRAAKAQSIWEVFGISEQSSAGASSSNQPPFQLAEGEVLDILSDSDMEPSGLEEAEEKKQKKKKQKMKLKEEAEGEAEADAAVEKKPASAATAGPRLLYCNPLTMTAFIQRGSDTLEIPLKQNPKDPLGPCIAELDSQILVTEVPCRLLSPAAAPKASVIQKRPAQQLRITKKRPASSCEDASAVEASEIQAEELVDRILLTKASKPPRAYLQSAIKDAMGRTIAKKYLVEVRQSETASYHQICETLKAKGEDKLGTIHHGALKKYLHDEKVQLLSK